MTVTFRSDERVDWLRVVRDVAVAAMELAVAEEFGASGMARTTLMPMLRERLISAGADETTVSLRSDERVSTGRETRAVAARVMAAAVALAVALVPSGMVRSTRTPMLPARR